MNHIREMDLDFLVESLDHNTAKTIFENFKDHKKLKKINIYDN